MDNSIATPRQQALSPHEVIKKYMSVANGIKLFVALWLCFFIFTKTTESHQEDVDTLTYLERPQIGDIYFLDFRALSDDLRPKEKYRIAKVVDITGEVATLLYGNMFYLHHKAATASIHYGQLRMKQYFESKRNDFSFTQLSTMHADGAIYMVKRPVKNMLYGNYINEPVEFVPSNHYTPGKRENSSGLSFLTSTHLENNYGQAFDRFTRSAELGFAEGQVNLGQMYVNGQYVKKDFNKALHWFNEAALQSNKAGILKYVIVCKQVEACFVEAFYQTLSDAGVNIKVRSEDLTG